MKPLAELNIGVQKEIGLEQVLKVWGFKVDAKNERIYVYYTIETISPTGAVVNISEEKCFERYNCQAVIEDDVEVISENLAFDKLRDSDIGKAISGMLLSDLKLFPNLQQK